MLLKSRLTTSRLLSDRTAGAAGGAGGGAVLTGSPVVIALPTSTTPGAQSITVPADAQIVIVTWSFWAYTSINAQLSSLTSSFTSGGFTHAVNYNGSQSDLNSIGTSYAVVTATGSQTITPAWGDILYEGPAFIVSFVKGVNTADYYRHAVQNAAASGAISAVVNSATTDLVLAHEGNYAGVPANQSGWTSRATQTNTSHHARLRSADAPGASTTTATTQSTGYPSIVAISIKSA